MSLVHPRSMAAVLALKGSFFRLEPNLDQAADGLTARHLFALGSDPLIDRRYLRRMPTLADLKA
jgi:hypothetical protein